VIADSSDLYRAGAVNCDGATLEMDNVTLRDNDAANGSAIHARDCNITLTDSEILDNSALSFGGAVWMEGGSLTLESTLVSGNQVGPLDDVASQGGAVYAADGAEIFIEPGSIFRDNRAYGDSSVGIAQGGAIYVQDSTVDCDGTSADPAGFESNALTTASIGSSGSVGTPASDEYGSAIWVDGSSVFTSSRCTFSGNEDYEIAEFGRCTRGNCNPDDNADNIAVGSGTELVVFDNLSNNYSGTCTAGEGQSGSQSGGGISVSWDFEGVECR
jgi:hypothetical protein